MRYSKKQFNIDYQKLKNLGLIVLGSTILSFGSYNFNYQNNVTEGGVLGLILFMKNIFDISPSITNVIIDFSLFLLGAKFLGKNFLIKCIISTITFSITYSIWESIGFVVPSFSGNMIFASIFAGLFVGIGVGLVVMSGGACGGDDVIAILGNKFTKLKVKHVYLLTDGIVLFLSLLYLNFAQIFYSLIAVTISGNIIGYMHNEEGLDKQKEAMS